MRHKSAKRIAFVSMDSSTDLTCSLLICLVFRGFFVHAMLMGICLKTSFASVTSAPTYCTLYSNNGPILKKALKGPTLSILAYLRHSIDSASYPIFQWYSKGALNSVFVWSVGFVDAIIWSVQNIINAHPKSVCIIPELKRNKMKREFFFRFEYHELFSEWYNAIQV